MERNVPGVAGFLESAVLVAMLLQSIVDLGGGINLLKSSEFIIPPKLIIQQSVIAAR